MKKIISLKIDGYDDRRELIAILAENGYKVYVKEEKDGVFNTNYFVIIELSHKEL